MSDRKLERKSDWKLNNKWSQRDRTYKGSKKKERIFYGRADRKGGGGGGGFCSVVFSKGHIGLLDQISDWNGVTVRPNRWEMRCFERPWLSQRPSRDADASKNEESVLGHFHHIMWFQVCILWPLQAAELDFMSAVTEICIDLGFKFGLWHRHTQCLTTLDYNRQVWSKRKYQLSIFQLKLATNPIWAV